LNSFQKLQDSSIHLINLLFPYFSILQRTSIDVDANLITYQLRCVKNPISLVWGCKDNNLIR